MPEEVIKISFAEIESPDKTLRVKFPQPLVLSPSSELTFQFTLIADKDAVLDGIEIRFTPITEIQLAKM